MGFSLSGPHALWTAVQISRAKSNSVPVKLSGEYSSIIFPGNFAARSFTIKVPFTAISMISSRPMPNTTSLCRVEVEL